MLVQLGMKLMRVCDGVFCVCVRAHAHELCGGHYIHSPHLYCIFPRHERKYRVCVINHQSKQDYMDLTWHNMTEKSESVLKFKESLNKSFPEYVPNTLDFKLGIWKGETPRNDELCVRCADLEKIFCSWSSWKR